MPLRKRKQKDLRVSNFAFSSAIFKRNHGSDGVKVSSNGPPALMTRDISCNQMMEANYSDVNAGNQTPLTHSLPQLVNRPD